MDIHAPTILMLREGTGFCPIPVSIHYTQQKWSIPIMPVINHHVIPMTLPFLVMKSQVYIYMYIYVYIYMCIYMYIYMCIIDQWNPTITVMQSKHKVHRIDGMTSTINFQQPVPIFPSLITFLTLFFILQSIHIYIYIYIIYIPIYPNHI